MHLKNKIPNNTSENIFFLYFLITVKYLQLCYQDTAQESENCFVLWEICIGENEMLIFMKTHLFLEQVLQLGIHDQLRQGYCNAQLWQKLDT